LSGKCERRLFGWPLGILNLIEQEIDETRG
jgi:hypothetical protein